MPRLANAFVALLFAMAASHAQGQTWPDKPVRFIVPAPAGTAPDIVARLIAEKLVPMWGQPVVVDNRGGAGGIPGMVAFVRSAPDGYTFAVVQTAVITLTPLLFKDPQFNVDTDIAAIAMTGTAPLIIAFNPGLGVNNLPDLVKLAKSQPGKVNFALPLLNSVPHLTGEMLSATAGIKQRGYQYGDPHARHRRPFCGAWCLSWPGFTQGRRRLRQGGAGALGEGSSRPWRATPMTERSTGDLRIRARAHPSSAAHQFFPLELQPMQQ